MVSKFLLSCILILICLKGHSTTYYFSTSTGLDSRSVNQAQNSTTPWQSINKLNSMASTFKPGDSILFKSGETFHGTLTLLRSGTPKAPIYFGNYDKGRTPILSGFKEINSWISKGGNLFEAFVPEQDSPIRTLTIDGDLHPLGRFPNSNATNGGYFTIQSCQNGKISGNLSKSSIDYKGGEIVIRKNNWILDRHLITSHSDNTINYDTINSEIIPTKDFGFFIQNHISTLDQHGEWYYDLSNRKIYIYYVGNPQNVRISSLNSLINIHNSASNLIFQNLIIQGSNENLINIYGSTNLTFENCIIENSGKNAINASLSKNLSIKNSTIKNSLNGGIFLGWQDQGMIFQNNIFENIFNFAGMGENGEMQGQAIYMSETSLNVLIESNYFKKCGYNVINFNGNNITIKNNLIDTYCFIKDDGAGIYTFTGSVNTNFNNRKIIGNIILNGIGADKGTKNYDPLKLPAVEGIYLDENASGVEIEGNTIVNVKSKGIFLNHARNSKIKNNKIINAGYSIYFANDKSIGLVENIEVTNNQFYSLNHKQIHYYLRSRSTDLSNLGVFDNNIFLNPLKDSQTIIVQTAKGTIELNLESWQKQSGLDKNSSLGTKEFLNIAQSAEILPREETSLFFDFNFSDSVKSVTLSGTYIDIKGIKVSGQIHIPPFSTVVLVKTQ